MAERDYDSNLDLIELNNLQRAISEVETALASSTPGSRPMFESLLMNAKSRVGTLDKKIKEAEEKRAAQSREDIVLSRMAESEKALSAPEREQFDGFLKKDFFTKDDFGALEKFYAKTWDRLSENGKNQMSKRVWEGIRRDEYTFSELPKVVQEKEADRAYAVFKKRDSEAAKDPHIPQVDRDDFIRAYESGDREKAGKVLERDSFKQNMFRGPESAVNLSKAAQGRGDAGAQIEKQTAKAADAPKPAPISGSKSDFDAAAINLDGLTMAPVPAKISSADLPSAVASNAKGGPSLRNG